MNYKTFATHAQDRGLGFEASDGTIAKFDALCRTETFSDETILIEQNGSADRLCFLISGTARFFKVRQTDSIPVATLNDPMTPLGISGMNSPGRYMSQVRVSAGSKVAILDLAKLRELHLSDPAFGAQFLALVLTEAVGLLWATRGLPGPPPRDPCPVAPGTIHESDHNVISRIQDAAFFAPLSATALKELMPYGEMRLYGAGETIVAEAMSYATIQVLFSGRVAAGFTNARGASPRMQQRTVARPGVALSLTNGQTDMPAPYTVTASRDTTMLCFSADQLRNLMAADPLLGSVLLQQQIWQIGRYQQSATGLSPMAEEDEAAHIAAILEDNSARIPVQSALWGVPHALRNRFTRAHALDCVYDAVISGTDAERSVAGLMMDVLDGVEREHRFFGNLNAVYTRVVSAGRDANAQTLRRLSNEDFSRAFDQVPFAIKGIENLPENPASIFIYNHLAACPDNELANGHAFSIDSHFISAKILLPRYGDGGQRIVRASRNTEFWRNGYYSRLDNIVVHTSEADWLDETPEQKMHRKEQLYIEAQRTIDSGRPLSIAPEGTSETADNLTATSPGPFKPGAFLIAGRLDPQPLIVPIAVANFDYPVGRTTYAAVIKAPFLISDHVRDVTDTSELSDFLERYREVFRRYVAEARALADEVQEKNADLASDIVTNIGLVSPVEEEFEADVRALEARLARPQNAGQVVLYGSSTFRLWADAAEDLGQSNLVNMGFGGATLTSCRSYFKRLVVPHAPETLIFYAGDNDIGGGKSAARLAEEFASFRAEVAENLPGTRCFVVSIKPSPFRLNMLEAIQDANAEIRAQTEADPKWQYIDFHTPMLDRSGAPSSVFYDADPLHVNVAGYGLLAKLIRSHLSAPH